MFGFVIRFFLLMAPVSLIYSQSTGSDLTLNLEQWLEDLDTLEKLILTQHAKPFWINQKPSFEKLIKKTRQNIAQPNTSPEEKLVELLKVIAFLKDGHSSIRGGDRYEIFGYLPFTAEWFDDALYVIRAHQPYRKALGAKIISVDGVPIANVVKRLKVVVPHANESRFKKFSPYYLHLPGLLYGLGITQNPKQATLTLQNDKGLTFEVKMDHLDPAKEAEMVEFGSKLPKLPLYRQQPEQAYWFEYLEEEQLLYLKYNRVTSMEHERHLVLFGSLVSIY